MFIGCERVQNCWALSLKGMTGKDRVVISGARTYFILVKFNC